MKKILISLLAVVVVGAGAFAATRAYFTDVEKSTGNTFDAGTIDIGVGDENVWTKNFHMEDMKPSQTDYVKFTVKNLGTNPVNIIKNLSKVVTDEGVMSESECTDGGGTWDEINHACDPNPSYLAKFDIDSVIEYDLDVRVKDGNGTEKWHQMLYDANKVISQIAGTDMFLGMVPEGWSMDVSQSYHMKDSTGNWAQGDKMTFDIVLTGEQLKGEVTLLPKSGDPKWLISFGGAKGTLTYKVKDSTFKYDFLGTGLVAGVDYTLLQVVDPWPQTGSRSLGHIAADGTGKVVISGNPDLGADIINSKLWLVLTADWDGTKLIHWNPGSYLFETGLFSYYDADL